MNGVRKNFFDDEGSQQPLKKKSRVTDFSSHIHHEAHANIFSFDNFYSNPYENGFVDFSKTRITAAKSEPESFNYRFHEYSDIIERVPIKSDIEFSNPNKTTNKLLREGDREMLTEYFYFLMQQMDLCHFSESDRRTKGGSREHVKVGFAGLCCRHCLGTPDARKFFWANVDRISNSFAEIPNHVLKCKHTPSTVKNNLIFLKKIHPQQLSKFPRGSQKAFLARMWDRMHSNSLENNIFKKDKNQGHDQTTMCGPLNVTSTGSEKHNFGRMTLAIPEDDAWLSSMDCFVRKNVEIFFANNDDVQNAKLSNITVEIGQVGLRCLFCSRTPEGLCPTAMRYPRSTSQISKFVRTFKTKHLQQCKCIPAEQKTLLMKMKKTSSLTSVLKRYYIISAKALGLTDKNGGVWLEKSGKKEETSATDKTRHSNAENIPNNSVLQIKYSSTDEYLIMNSMDFDCFESTITTAV